MNKSFLIHVDNTTATSVVTNNFPFKIKDGNIDKSIEEYIENNILKKEYDVLLIKDSLSNNYLEFYGLLMAYHIRLLNEKNLERYLPIVIISDLNMYQLDRLTNLSDICHTQGIYFVDNNKEKIKKFLENDLKPLKTSEYTNAFLNRVNIVPPSNYDSKHSISNEWSIWQWSKCLKIKDDDNIKRTIENISSMLYFKYLENNSNIHENLCSIDIKDVTPKGDGRILYIDDEWKKGWGKIFETLTNNNQNITLKYDFGIDFKNTSQNKIKDICVNEIKKEEFDPDVIILDLRLSDDDFKKDIDINKITGVQILQEIPKINPGIRTIVLSATGDSQILKMINKIKYANDKQYTILNYFKKENPEDKKINIKENITQLINEIKKGLKDKYLKNIYEISKEAITYLSDKSFQQYGMKREDYIDDMKFLQNNMKYIFEVLNSEMPNKLNYALVSIAISLETINKIFLQEKGKYENLEFWDGEGTSLESTTNVESKMHYILNHKLGNQSDIKLSELIKRRNDFMHSNDDFKEVKKEEIEEWFRTLVDIIEIIQNPPQYKVFKE